MALQKSKSFPKKTNFEDKDSIDSYIVEIIYEIQSMYDELQDSINGSIKSSFYQQKELWTPILNGSVTSGTFTYTNQIGWVYRQGLIVDVWGDLIWTDCGTATGNLYLELPYLVANSTGIPFVGHVQSSGITFDIGNTCLSINAITDSYKAEFWQSGSAIANSNLLVSPSGRIIFHVRYLGVQDE